ncbi:hypothetical protein DIPPA_26392 [Diplonema papillatum]|nr:hypothetical protein DIPPA_26392 [Diplonema papillatum]
MEWRPVIVFMTAPDVLDLRVLNRYFDGLAMEGSTWRQYSSAVIECSQALIARGRAEEALPLVRETGATVDKMYRLWKEKTGGGQSAYDEIKGKLKLLESYVIHCMHWTVGYCPMKWGAESSLAAWLALRHFTMFADERTGLRSSTDRNGSSIAFAAILRPCAAGEEEGAAEVGCKGDESRVSRRESGIGFTRRGKAASCTSFLDDVQQATVWALCLYAWNGARFQMKLPGATVALFKPFFHAARLARDKAESMPLLKALATFTEGYVHFAVGFSGAGSSHDFEKGYSLQQDGYSAWVAGKESAAESPDAMSVEMAERLARTARFVAAQTGASAELPIALYQYALVTSRSVWPPAGGGGGQPHPFTTALEEILRSYKRPARPPQEALS